MSSEIIANTVKYLSEDREDVLYIKFYAYLNTVTGQLFHRSSEIKKTENVKHLARVKGLDYKVTADPWFWIGKE